jgi:UDP-galactopyranose mutase
MKVDYLVVGAGFAGCTVAERIATQFNKKVLLVEQRNHIGGNAYDFYNEDGILVQKYGPHIFHTNSVKVWRYLSKYTDWNGYVHRVLANVKGKEVYLPINLDTMERLYDRRFSPKQLENYFQVKRIKIDRIKNSRDVVVSQVGEDLYELFFKNYTKKQWGVYPDELEPQVTSRLPVRLNRDTRYFSDKYQGVPKYGYTRMFEKMLDDKNIHILLNTDYKETINSIKFKTMIFTGPIDYFFDFKYGKLPYRSLDFKFKTLNMEKFQDAAVVNYPNEHKYTRITEYKHFYFQKHDKTTICYEYPKSEGDPYYPIPAPDYQEIYLKYKKQADKLKNVYFIGRLAEYRYLNMDQVVNEALKIFERIRND